MPRRFRCRRTARRRSFNSASTASSIASRARPKYSDMWSRYSETWSRISSRGMRSQTSPPRRAVQRAPATPARAALRPAHAAPRLTPLIMGDTGRRPVGPRRNMNVSPAPRVMPMMAAVSRSYSASRLSSPPRARTETRGCCVRVCGRFGPAVVAIALLLNVEFVCRIGGIELF
jgi:hypothetical protein